MAGITNVQWQLQADNSDLVRELKEARAELANLNKTFGNVEKSAKEAGDAGVKSMDKIEKETKQAAQSTNSLANNLKNVAVAAAAFAAANILGGFGKSVIDITAQFEKFKAVLTNTFGSAGIANNVQDFIIDFAAKTPFAVTEITDAFVKFAGAGKKLNELELTSLGDLAASRGKSLDQLTEAVLDAFQGEGERLKEFGVKTQKEGDKMKFTFKGIQTQVDFTEKAIGDYIFGLGKLQGVSGSMAAISKTLAGQISNLGDTFDQFQNKLGKAVAPQVKNIITIIGDFISSLNTKPFADFIGVVSNLFGELFVILGDLFVKSGVVDGIVTFGTLTVEAFSAVVGSIKETLEALNLLETTTEKMLRKKSLEAGLRDLKLEQDEEVRIFKEGRMKLLNERVLSDAELAKVSAENIRKRIEAGSKVSKEEMLKFLHDEIRLIDQSTELENQAFGERGIAAERFVARVGSLRDFFSFGSVVSDEIKAAFDSLSEEERQFLKDHKTRLDAQSIEIKKRELLIDSINSESKKAKAAAKAHKDTAKAINEHVKALETLSGAIRKDAEKQAAETAELQRADVQNLIDLQIEKDQIERDYTLGKFDREKAVFEQEQKIEKAEFDIEKNNQIKEANDRIKRDQEEIQRRIDARDTAFVVAIAKEKDNLTKLSGEQRELQQKKIEQLEAERQVAVQTGNAEIDRIRKEGAILIENSQKNIDKKELDLLKVQGDAKKALTEKQEKERGELILKLNNDIFAAENALAKTNFEAESIFRIADLKKFSTHRERLEKEHLERLRKIDEEEAAKKDDLQSKGEEFTTKIQREFQLKREKETREHQTNINKSWREQIVAVIDAFTQGLKIFQELFDTFANISKERLQKVIDERGKKIDEINERADNGQRISVEQLRIEEERQARAVEAQEQIAQRQIEIAQAVATANAIAAIAKAAAEGVGIASIFTIAATVAALVAGYAAANEATRASTPPLLAEGGVISNGKILHPNKNTILEGKSHKEGGMLIEAEHGEAFISKENTKKYQEPINAIMAGTFEEFASKYTLPRPVNYDARLFNEMVSQFNRNQVDMGGVESRLDSLEKTFSNSIKQIPSTYVKITEGGLETTVSKVQIDKEIAQNRAKF